MIHTFKQKASPSANYTHAALKIAASKAAASKRAPHLDTPLDSQDFDSMESQNMNLDRSSTFILSIDQGTTGTTALLVDLNGKVRGKETQEFPQHFPKPGWVEHQPQEIWESVKGAVSTLMRNFSGASIHAIGITNQRETVIVWDKKTGEPVYPAIVWQCRRTHSDCLKLSKKWVHWRESSKSQNGKVKGKKTKKKIAFSDWIHKKTGLVLDPYFSATKLRWIIHNVHGVSKKVSSQEWIAGTIDTFLLWKLTGGQSHFTDVSNASRTLLMNIQTGEWDSELLKAFSIPKSWLPEIRDSAGHFGVTQGLDFLPDNIPIRGMAGDQQAALFGQACFGRGEAKCTFGTGSFLVLNTGNKIVFSKHRLLTTVAWRLPGEKMVYALEGGAFVCGAIVQWLRDGLGLIQKSSDIEELALKVSDSGGVEFVPALTGLGAPYWRADVRGQWSGLTRGTNASHIARATLEAMALQNAEILKSMEKDLRKKMSTLKVDGGASANDLLMQTQSDTMNLKVVRPRVIETTSLGAAYLAGMGSGIWKNKEEIRKIWEFEKEFQPKWNTIQRKKRWESWLKAVHQLLGNQSTK